MIETAIQKGNIVYVYGNGNRQLFSKCGELYGYIKGDSRLKKSPTNGSAMAGL